MEAFSVGLQVAYGVHLPAAVGAASGPQRHGEAPRAAAFREEEPPASSRVTISAAGRSLLAAAGQPPTLATAGAQAQNTPVTAPQEGTTARNETNLASRPAEDAAANSNAANNNSAGEQAARVRLDAAQSRQDNGPALAQSSIRDHREVFVT
ncbi:MAG: hypothetical protein LBO00_05660 [Zoogloeaceae bacterium]|jgi:hypothetical protein|nr:hypothetical protein [Zoogloeaceae bacterium]